MKFISLVLIAAIFQVTVTQALDKEPVFDDTNATLYSYHFLGINGTDSANNVGYLQTYNGVEYYAYNGNSLCLLTATNSSGSITQFTASNDFGKCPDFVSGVLTELTYHSDGYYLNANNNDQWHLTWFTTGNNLQHEATYNYDHIFQVGFGLDFSNQFWRISGDCSAIQIGSYGDKTLFEQAQAWGPMSYRIESCYLVKADPLDKGTPTGSYYGNQFYSNSTYEWNKEFVKSWYVIDPFPGSCPYYDNGWRTFNVESTAIDSLKVDDGLFGPSKFENQIQEIWPNVYMFLRNSNDGPDGQKMAAFTNNLFAYTQQARRYGCFANFLSMAAVPAALALSSFFY